MRSFTGLIGITLDSILITKHFEVPVCLNIVFCGIRIEMATPNSSLEISLNSTSESVILPRFGAPQQSPGNVPHKTTNDDRDTLIDRIAQLYVKHPMSLECLTDWTDLINTRLELCDQLPTGKVQLINLIREKQRDLVDIFFFVTCDKCCKSTKVPSDEKKGLKCSYCDQLLKKNETNFFVILPIEKQILQSLEDNWGEINKFWTDISESDSSDKIFYTDAHDGAILRNVLNEYKESDVNILSLCLNVDGANKFKSNSYSVWPIQLVQNYMPPYMRFIPQNIIVNGLYYHKSKSDKPLNFREYLRPLINELNTLKRSPISMEVDGDHYQFKPVVTHCAIDLPAKSKLQETKQFGGYDACTYCEIRGEKILLEKPKSTVKPKTNLQKTLNTNTKHKAKPRTNPPKKNTVSTIAKANEPDTEIIAEKKPKYAVRYVEGDCKYKLRDKIETLKKMLAASEFDGNKPIDGIKDVSCLVAFEHFNIIWSLSTEYMHLCLQGMGKRLLNLFLNPSFSDKRYYIAPSKRKWLNNRITHIRPTSSIVRKPRSLGQRANYKASEYRSMILYYLPVCLPGCLPDIYVKHVRLFSAATYILLKKRISSEEVDRAEEMLKTFVRQHQELFGKHNMVMVVHLLNHLAESVRELGPLWCHSAFPFERKNGCLLKMVNGTTDVMHQISSKYCLSKSVNRKQMGLDGNGNVITNADTKKNDPMGLMLLGKAENFNEKASHIFDTLSLDIVKLENILQVHRRIKLKGIIYTSELYTRPKKSIDYFIGLQNGTIGIAKYYFTHADRICVMLQAFDIIDQIDHIDKVLKTTRLIIAPVVEIEKKYLYMKVGLHNYVVCRPNPYENE